MVLTVRDSVLRPHSIKQMWPSGGKGVAAGTGLGRDRTGLFMLVDLFVISFFLYFSVCPVWWTKMLHLSFLLHF